MINAPTTSEPLINMQIKFVVNIRQIFLWCANLACGTLHCASILNEIIFIDEFILFHRLKNPGSRDMHHDGSYNIEFCKRGRGWSEIKINVLVVSGR